MNPRDEALRNEITDTLTQAGVDARSLAVEVRHGAVLVQGIVPSVEQERKLRAVLEDLSVRPQRYAVNVLPVAGSDSVDGRGRSPLTGTSADSAHESRHQLDPK
ncbi:MAG: hypothetical protein ACOY4R_21750 [Pseudomonadota bacterium]